MKKSTVVLAIAAICMLAVIGCKNAAVTPPDSNPTTMLSARFTDSTADKTYEFSLEEPAANSAVVNGKLYSQALAKTFSLKGLVNTVSGDFTLSMRSSTAGIRADVTGNTKKTDGTGLTLKVSMKENDTWLEATPINPDAASVKTGTDAVEVTGTVDSAAQDVSLPDEMLGTWKLYPTYFKVREQSNPDDEYPYEELSAGGFSDMAMPGSKISEPYYAIRFPIYWMLFKKETVDGKTTLWHTKDTVIIDEEKVKQTDWAEYAKTLDYYSKADADFVATQTPIVYPFMCDRLKVEIKNITGKVSTADLEAYVNNLPLMLGYFYEIEKKDDGFDIITNTGDNLRYYKFKYSLANNILKQHIYFTDLETGHQSVDTIEEARKLTILPDETFVSIFTR